MLFLREHCFLLEKLEACRSEQLTAGDETLTTKFLSTEIEPHEVFEAQELRARRVGINLKALFVRGNAL